MVSNPPSEKELKELARSHWKEHRPKLFAELQESGDVEESLNQAVKNTLDAYQQAKSQLLKNGYQGTSPTRARASLTTSESRSGWLTMVKDGILSSSL